MRVGYDAQAFLSPNRGTGKGAQLRNLVGPFLDQFIGFASSGPNHSGVALVQEGFSRYTLWQQFSLPRSLRKHDINVFLAPYNVAPICLSRKVKLVLVLHDTIQFQNFSKPDLRGRLMDRYHCVQVPPSVRRAHCVLTVSEYSRKEILRIFPDANVRVIPCTVSNPWFDPAPISDRRGYLLLVTSSAPHKNTGGALQGYAQYAARAGKATKPLKIVGLSREKAPYERQLTELRIRDLVTFLPFLEEEQLIITYKQADALLVPSFAEGFGIPVLEAMATGTPVIAARVASLPEVGGDAAYYFNPHRPHEIGDALHRFLSADDLRREMADRGCRRAQLFHPSIVRNQVIAFWKEMAEAVPDQFVARKTPIKHASLFSWQDECSE
jgi:glycosyltransferase involved in cell wall biosynthesis